MSSELTGICCQHTFDKSAAICNRCGWEFCEHCIVAPRGKASCKDCAMLTGGIRHVAERKAMPRRRVKQRIQAHKVLRASRGEPDENEPMLTDPLLEDHDPLGPPTGEGLEKAGMSMEGVASQPFPSSDDNEYESEPVRTPAPNEPQAIDPSGPIDWNNPFG